jgi:hypothetical protein
MEDHTDTKGINMMRKRQIQDLMTQDEIIDMAILEAEFVSHGKPSEEESELFVCTDKDIVRFYKLVAAKEREAAIKIIKETPFSNWFPDDVIEAIRARGQA